MGLPSSLSPTDIKENWQGSDQGTTNPCLDCPRRDEEGKLHPYFAVAGGDLQFNDGELECEDLSVEELPEAINVVLVGEAPGGTQSYNNREKRTAKDTPGDVSLDTREYPIPMYDDDGEPTGNVGDWEEFAIQLAKNWPSEDRGELGVYYTNHTKCSDIHLEDNGGRKIDRGDCHCSHYLIPELQYLNPDAVIMFSGNRANHLRQGLADLGLSIPRSGSIKDVVFDTDKISAEDPAGHPFQVRDSTKLPDTPIFASYHWQRGMSSVSGAISGPQVYLQQYLPEETTKTKTLYAAGLAGAIIEETT